MLFSFIPQRGSDELLSQTTTVSNGSIMSPQPNHSDNNNDAKKVKLDKNQNGKPSRVIHIRNIPNEVTEPEIIHLGIPFGRVTNVLVLKGKNQVRGLYKIYATLIIVRGTIDATLNFCLNMALNS